MQRNNNYGNSNPSKIVEVKGRRAMAGKNEQYCFNRGREERRRDNQQAPPPPTTDPRRRRCRLPKSQAISPLPQSHRRPPFTPIREKKLFPPPPLFLLTNHCDVGRSSGEKRGGSPAAHKLTMGFSCSPPLFAPSPFDLLLLLLLSSLLHRLEGGEEGIDKSGGRGLLLQLS